MATDTRIPCSFPRRISAYHAASLTHRWIGTLLPAQSHWRTWLSALWRQLAAQRTSFAAVARRAEEFPSISLLEQRWRKWRRSQSFSQWETQIDAALCEPWRTVLHGEPVWLIADWHAVPYWGTVPAALAPHVRRGMPQSGTTRFFVYATLAVLWHGVRIQVALTEVGATDSQTDVVTRLWRRAQRLLLRPLGWILDKGFYCTGVVALLREQKQPYLIAAPRRGAKQGVAAVLERLEEQYGFQEEPPPDLTQVYEMHSLHQEVLPQETTLIIGWEPVSARPKQRRQRTVRRSAIQPGQKWRAVAWIGGGRHWTAQRAQRAYAPRTGFESGYRLSKACRGRSSSRDPAWRLLLVAMSLLLQNAWIWLLLEGKRTLHRRWKSLRDQLPFIDFCCWIVRFLEYDTRHRMDLDLPGV
jgi:hypothetical protein